MSFAYAISQAIHCNTCPVGTYFLQHFPEELWNNECIGLPKTANLSGPRRIGHEAIAGPPRTPGLVATKGPAGLERVSAVSG